VRRKTSGVVDGAADDDQAHAQQGTTDSGCRREARAHGRKRDAITISEGTRNVSEHGIYADRRQLEALQRVTDAALATLTEEQLLRELLVRISEILSTDTAAILLLDESGTLLHARAAKGIEEEVEQGVKIPVGKGFAGRVAAERRPVFIEDVDHADVLNPILREKGIRSLLGVPLLVEGRVLGVLHVGSLTRRRFTTDERDLLQLAADRAALAIEHAVLYEQHQLAESLQRRLLPTDLGGTGGLELATRYLPASHGSLGGDWYDAFPLSDGRVAVVIGDVVGHGVAAAAVMAQLRTALRAYAIEDRPPGGVVEAVNRLMCELGPKSMTTMAYALIDPDDESIEVVSAGHPPPLVIAADGEATYLPVRGSIPLAVSPAARYEGERFAFEAGSTVLLYTDGLVESRHAPIDRGLERLRAIARGAAGVELMCTDIVDRQVPTERADDVALIAARLVPLPARLRSRWPAERQALAGIRRLLRRWLKAHGATEEEAYDIVVACQEACANAVEHAYRPGRHWFELDAARDDGHRIRVTVRDEGRWRPPRGVHRGRGVDLMHTLMDSVELDHTERGTVVVLERQLGMRPA
jgi:serine phosphatase RsbU (regulator of sigma subunit)/anti-sigma regulatory factor (Ser/Thr protein kinase)